ncbi:5990_t:CDS:2, partial [Paraglomus occultum]
LWLDGNEEKSRRQLLIGKGSIQIWKRLPDGYRLLLYIYAFKIKAKPREVTITVYKNGFDLKIELDDDDLLIKWPVDPSKSVIDACKALEWLDEEKDKNYGQFERRVLFDEIKHQVTNIVRIFIKYHPDEWRLLEVRHDLMKSLIIGGCSRLTQDLVRVSDDENNEDEKDRLALHIPRKYSWHNDNGTLKEKKTDIMVAIEKRDKLTENFLAYYAHHAKDHYSWMHTMGQALLALSESSKRSNLDINRKRLFAHPTFAGDISHGHKHFPASYTTNFRLLPEINYNLRSLILTEDDIMLIANLRQTYMIVKGTLRFKLWVRQLKRRLRNVKLGMIVKVMLTPFSFALKMIEHAVDRVSSRVHEIRRFPVPVDVDVVVRILRNAVAEGGSEIFSEHPFFTGLINNAWEETSHFYFVFLILFFSYLIAFDIFIWEFIHQNNSHYALVIYLFVIGTYYALFELNELRYHKRKSRTFYKIVNVILPIITTAVLTSRATRDDNGAWGFSQTEIGRGIIFLISISTFIMWFQLLMLLRLFEETILRILPFLVSLFILVVAFGHAMYVLLHDPTQIGLSPNLLQLGVNMTTPDGGVEHTNYTVYQNYNPQDVSDNSFASFWTSVLSSYNWMNGRWDNVDWNYYPVTIFTVIASLLLVIIMLNILIAIMGDVYDDAKVFGKREFLRLRARFVLYADDFGNMLWSALFRSYKSSSRFEEVVKKNPRYMYVLGNRRQFEQWVEERGIFREFTKPQDVQEKLTDHSCFNLEDNDHWNAFTFENSDRYRNILN